jgi:GT2 family glycosyltransferase
MTADATLAPLTVAVTTRDRPQALARCLGSLDLLGNAVRQILVADDASRVPPGAVIAALPERVRHRIRVINMPDAPGLIVGRNRMIEQAETEYVLILDDDAFVLDGRGICASLALLDGDPTLAAVAFAQAELNGAPWPATMQPAPVSYRCYVPAFIGFGHLMRRSTFLRLGGYDESFVIQGEERDWCLRALDAGFRVVYLPDVRVGHAADPGGRSPVRYLRYVVRNDCLSALRHEPLPLPLLSVPLRMRRYFTMRRSGGVDDPGGFRWLVGEILAAVPSAAWSHRVRWRTLREWRQMRREPPPYPAGSFA